MSRWTAGDVLGLQERRARGEKTRERILDDNDGKRDGHATFVLPWPPSLNHAYASGERCRFVTEEQKAFRRRVAGLMTLVKRPLRGRLAVSVVCYPPDARRRDLDNLCKPIGDALQHAGLFADDEQIDQWHVIRARTIGQGSVTVTVAEI